MLTMEEALALLGAVGSDSAPTAEELRNARGVFVSAAKEAKTKGDREALASMLEAIKVSDQAINEAEELEAKEAEELSALVQDIPELAEEVEENSTETEEKPESTHRMMSVAEAAQRLGLTAPVERVEVIETEPRQTLTINGEDASDAGWDKLADSFAKFTKQSIRGGRSTIATFKTDYSTQLSGKAGENTRVLDQLSRQAGEEAVIAAGGCCSLAEPIRDQPMLASLARPIADSLPTVGAGAGRVSFYAPVCLPQGGVGVWTCEDDEAVDEGDPETWKDCVEIDCVDPQEVVVDAIYHCLTIGNFQQRFSPERWEAILHATAAAQARMAEQALFNQIANADETTQHTVADTGSVYSTTVRALLTAAATIRQNQRYEGRRFKAILPSWVRDAAELDLLGRAIQRGRSVESDSLEVILARGGVDVTWSPDIDPIEPDGQVDGPLTQFPGEAQAVLYVDGGAFRLDGGELNLGTDIRDHDLNRQNKVASFAETFEAAVVRSCDTKHITIPVTVCDLDLCPEPADNGDNGDNGNGDG